jgi:hypothetical protein
MLVPSISSEPKTRIELPDAPRWGQAKRILFRFTFSYILLSTFTYLPYFLPFLYGLAQPYLKLWDILVPWAGSTLFHADTSVLPNLSGDTTYNYVQVFCFAMLALAATAIWTLLDRRRANYARLQEGLRVWVRLALAFWMLSYGIVKVVPVQFHTLTLDRLLQPFGDASPNGLLWTFMAASPAYTIFSGLAEVLGGLLLLARRTTLLGALVSIAVLTNVVALNFCYDVAVKLFSLHLLALAVFLVLPDLGRLADLFVFDRKVEPSGIPPLSKNKWLDRAMVLPAVFVLGVSAFHLYRVYQFSQEPVPKPKLAGIWNVEEFVLDGRARPPLVSDETRWRRVVFDEPHVIALFTGDSRQRFRFDLELASHRLTFSKEDDPRWSSYLSYQRLDPRLLAMEGMFDGHKVQARLRRMNEPRFPLVNRGFQNR